LLGGRSTTIAGFRRREQGAPHGEENTCVDAHSPVALRSDRGSSWLARWRCGTGQAGDAADRRRGTGGGEPGCAGAGLLRARRRAWPGLPQRRAAGAAEDGGRPDRVCSAADRRARCAVPLRDPRPSERPDRGAGGSGRGAAGPRPVGARHRGRLPGRDRPAAAVAHGGLRTRRAALGRLSGLRGPGPRRIRHCLSVRRRHRRAHPAWPAPRAGDGGLGLHGDRREGTARADGGVEGRGRRKMPRR